MTEPEPTEPITTEEETAPPAPPAPPPSWPPVGTVVAGLVLLAMGVLWLLDTTGVLDIRLTLLVPAALGVVGIALMIGAFRDRPHPGLVTLGVFLTIATLFLSLLPVGLRGGVGERTVRVTEMSALEDRYDLALGRITVDLSELEMTSSAEVAVSIGAGEVTVLVPDGVVVTVDASAGAGEIDVLGERAQGILPDVSYTSGGTGVTLHLEINVGAGRVEVRR